MTNFTVRYVHRIAPKASDVGSDIDIQDSALSDSRSLAGALRKAGVLEGGARLRSFRVEGDKVLCFPDRGIWHCIALERAVTSR